MKVVLGIDPGLASTGYGVVRLDDGTIRVLDGGVIETPSGLAQSRRLERIHGALLHLVGEHAPQAVALEELYFGRNVRSAVAVGQARGVALLAAAQRGVPCFDYTPQEVKLAVCGTGAASKEQVQRMVASLLGLTRPPSSDHAADALAVAICHASHMAMDGAVERAAAEVTA